MWYKVIGVWYNKKVLKKYRKVTKNYRFFPEFLSDIRVNLRESIDKFLEQGVIQAKCAGVMQGSFETPAQL